MGTEGTPVLEPLGQLGSRPAATPFGATSAPTTAGTATLGLPGRLESVRQARDFTRRTLGDWELPEQFDTVGLVVSELVTNALRHGLPAWAAEYDTGQPLVALELTRTARRLACAVRDPGTSAPRVSPLDDEGCVEAESGRGLRLVECFSDGWGWRPLTGRASGKVVWAVFQTG